MIHFFFVGMILGLSAGLAPGPLLTLVICETIQHDVRAGIKAAMAPLVTDLPIVALTVFVLSRLSGFNSVLGIISIVGGILVMGMGISGLKTKGMDLKIEKSRPRPLLKGILVNSLSPHPYLFWLSVGVPTMARANERHAFAAAFYVIGFYLFLIGSKIALAILTGKSRSVLKGRVYIFVMRFLGALLCLLALFLFKDGFGFLGS